MNPAASRFEFQITKVRFTWRKPMVSRHIPNTYAAVLQFRHSDDSDRVGSDFPDLQFTTGRFWVTHNCIATVAILSNTIYNERFITNNL
ncbi:MAG: hypothetical protein CMQ20_01850 [Gammaproteobacteria bacterium]|nr:hypothetical protein [Gammaproteobacteria bacterium]